MTNYLCSSTQYQSKHTLAIANPVEKKSFQEVLPKTIDIILNGEKFAEMPEIRDDYKEVCSVSFLLKNSELFGTSIIVNIHY